MRERIKKIIDENFRECQRIFDIQNLLWKIRPKNWQKFKESIKNKGLYKKTLKWLLKKANNTMLQNDEIKYFYNLVFFINFSNYKLEDRAIKYLNNRCKWNVKKSSNYKDSHFLIDLEGTDHNKHNCVIQVKRCKEQFETNKKLKYKKLIEYAENYESDVYLLSFVENKPKITVLYKSEKIKSFKDILIK